MMSKIKSSKIANIKILIGIVLAASLIAVFACEQKQSIEQDNAAKNKTVKIDYNGQSLQVTGDSTAIDNLKSLVKIAGNYKIVRDISTGDLVFSKKSENSSQQTLDSNQTEANTDQVFMVVEEMPEYPGGVPALRQFLAQTVKYPVIAQENGIQGKVYVNFVVEKDGSVGAVKIARGVSPELDAEAFRVVKLLNNWKPGRQKGEDVRVSYTLPIQFKLQ